MGSVGVATSSSSATSFRAGGNPRLTYQNMRMSAAKAIAPPSDLTPAGKLTASALERLRSDIRQEWEDMPPEERKWYYDMFAAEQEDRKQRQRAQAQPAATIQADMGTSTASHWGMGAATASVHPKLVQAALRSKWPVPGRAEVADPAEFLIGAPVASLLGEGIVLEGCPHRPRNACRAMVGIQLVDEIARAFTRIARACGGELVKSGDILLLCEGEGVHEPTVVEPVRVVRFFALLTGASWQPVCQEMTMCVASAGQEADNKVMPLPLEVELESALVRLTLHGAPDVSAFSHATSDELAARMAMVAPQWHIKVCMYDLLSATRMRITGFSDDLALAVTVGGPGARRRAGHRRPNWLREAADLVMSGDPFAHRARPSAWEQTGSGHHGGNLDHAAAEGDGDFDLEVALADHMANLDDEDLLAAPPSAAEGPGSVRPGLSSSLDRELLGLGAGLLELPRAERDLLDMHEGGLSDEDEFGDEADLATLGAQSAADGVQVASELVAAFLGDDGAEVAEGEASSSASGGVVAEGAAAGSSHDTGVALTAPAALDTNAPAPAEGDGQDAPSNPPPSSVPEGWVRTPDGHVLDRQGALVGRITFFKNGNVAARCRVHPNCSVARRVERCTPEQMMIWLARGQAELPVPPDADAVAARRLAAVHKIMI